MKEASALVWLVEIEDDAPLERKCEGLQRILEESGAVDRLCGEGDVAPLLALKLHVGDEDNRTRPPAELAAVVVRNFTGRGARMFLTETSTLYRGVRDDAVKHILHAARQGFTLEKTGAPWVMADGLLGDSETDVRIEGELFDSVSVAREIRLVDGLVTLSHLTGHLVCGFGGAVKNLGMGLASRKGKMRQHSSMKPAIVESRCTGCARCVQWCPADAIRLEGGKASISGQKCVGCGECLAVCRAGAVKFDWGVDSAWLQRAMAEHALGAVKDLPSFHLLYALDITPQCDCIPGAQKRGMEGVGILGSYDPVALDAAALRLCRERRGTDPNEAFHPHIDGSVQLLHAEKVGLGSSRYELRTL